MTKVLTVSGYKPMELNIFKPDDERIAYIKAALRKRLTGFIEEGLEWVLISGQMGVELWTAEEVLDLSEEYDIKLGMIPPFEGQESRWPEVMQQTYAELTAAADFHQPLYKGEYKGPYQFKTRDKWLISKSEACLLLIDEEHQGSVRFFYQEAKRTEGYPVFTITPDDLDDIVEEIQMQDPSYWK